MAKVITISLIMVKVITIVLIMIMKLVTDGIKMVSVTH